jgi:hypothetical protein
MEYDGLDSISSQYGGAVLSMLGSQLRGRPRESFVYILFDVFIDGLLEHLAMQPLDTKIRCISSSNLAGSRASLTYSDDVAALSLDQNPKSH